VTFQQVKEAENMHESAEYSEADLLSLVACDLTVSVFLDTVSRILLHYPD
jgi:hypothetical protein